MAHPKIRALYRKVEKEEIMPHVKAVPGYSPAEYVDLIAHRFSNPAIADTTRRVAFDGSSRHPGFIIPSIRDGLHAGTPVQGLALVSAAWARYCLGTREDGSVVEPNDPLWDELNVYSSAAKESPKRWLEMRSIYGDLADEPYFFSPFEKWLHKIYDRGMEAALNDYLDE
jgi:mannitol 2-dehydrogenase